MNTIELPGCAGYITAQSQRFHHSERTQLPAIAICRETGTGAAAIAQLVAEKLNGSNAEAECPWTTFGKELVEEVIKDHGLADQIRKFMPEDSTSDLKDAVEEMLGLHPSNWTLVHFTTETVLRLANAGNSIIIGRGSTEITARMPHVLRVRLVAPAAKRILTIAERRQLSRDDAETYVHKTDQARRRYVERNFTTKIENPLGYHLTINTGPMTQQQVADLIVAAVGSLDPHPVAV